MTISLGELVAAAKQQDDQIGVSDRWQKGVNDLSEGIGTIFGSIYGGRLVGGLGNAAKAPNGQNGIDPNISSAGNKLGWDQNTMGKVQEIINKYRAGQQ